MPYLRVNLFCAYEINATVAVERNIIFHDILDNILYSIFYLLYIGTRLYMFDMYFISYSFILYPAHNLFKENNKLNNVSYKRYFSFSMYIDDKAFSCISP